MSNNENGRGKVYKQSDGGKAGNRKLLRGKCDVRLTAEEDLMLSQLAERNDVTRSEIMRKALKDFVKFNMG